MFHSANAGTFKNAHHYKNPKVDELLDKAVQSTDQAARAKLYEEAVRIVVADAPGLWIYNTKWYGPYSKSFWGIVFCPIGNAQEMRTAYYGGHRVRGHDPDEGRGPVRKRRIDLAPGHRQDDGQSHVECASSP